MELGKKRHREIYLVRFAGSGVAAMYWTPGVLSRFRREDIADCLLVPFDFFLSSLSENTRGERDLCREHGDFFTVAYSDPGFDSKLRSRV